MLEKLFRLSEQGATLRREFVGGLTTFTTMAYIIFVQPAILGATGMDAQAVMVATCLSSALATFVMGFLANYAIALAPGMGLNVFFAYTVVLTLGYTWQQALAATFISGLIFLALSTVGLREKLVHAVPPALKNAIAVGIGLLIAMVGMQWSGIVVEHPGTLVGLGDLRSPPVLLAICGFTVMALLLARGIRAAILIGIGVNLAVGLVVGMVQYQGILAPVPSLAPTFLQLDFSGVLQTGLLSIIFVFFFVDLFDTVGTLIGVSQKAGFLRPDGSLPRSRQALLADAIGTATGALLGTSTVTSYIESASGVSVGARTGLANMVTGALFLLALFFTPLVGTVGGGVPAGEGKLLYPVVSPALIVVGCFMLKPVSQIRWDDWGEAIPAFLTVLIMPLTFSITDGIAFGFISYTLLKVFMGEIRQVPTLVVVFAMLFAVRYAFF